MGQFLPVLALVVLGALFAGVSAEIRDSTVSGNSTLGMGGGFYFNGTAVTGDLEIQLTRSTITPIRKEISAATINATQKFVPHWIICQHRYVLNIAISPCAKFKWSVDTKIITSAKATQA